MTIPCELLVVVLGPPRPARRRDLERRIVEQARERDRGRPLVGLQRRGVGERLERAPRLTARLRAAIELRGGVVASPHQGEQLAGLRAQRDQATLKRTRGLLGMQARVALLELRDALAQRDRREALRAAVERRVDAQPIGLEHARVVDVGELAAQQVQEIPGVARVGGHRGEPQAARPAPWRGPPASSRPCCSIISSTRLRRRTARSGLAIGREPVRALDHRREQGRLGDVELARALAEEDVRRLADAVDRRGTALSEIDLVQVGLEDLVLVVTSLDDERHRGFLELAPERALGRQEEVLDELLGDGAPALTHGAGAQVRDQRARDPAQVDAAVRPRSADPRRRGSRPPDGRGSSLELHELALLAVRAVEGADRLRLEQHRAELASARQLADLLDQASRRAGARRRARAPSASGCSNAWRWMRARLAPQAYSPGREPPRLACLAEAQARERRAQIDQLPVEPWVQDRRRREDPRRHLESAGPRSGRARCGRGSAR